MQLIWVATQLYIADGNLIAELRVTAAENVFRVLLCDFYSLSECKSFYFATY